VKGGSQRERRPPSRAAGPPTHGPVLEIRGLKVHFPITKGAIFRRRVGTVRAVDGADLTIASRETVGLVGESGSGKTTLGRAILRIHQPSAGTIRLGDADLSSLEGTALRRTRRHVQMIFQDPYSSLHPRMKVAAIVSEPLEIHRIGTKQVRQVRVADLLSLVGLKPEHAGRYPHQLSGGERQRVGIARALALSPELVVADEPVSSLDVSIQAQIVNLLQRLQDELDLAYLFIAHDLSVVRQIAHRVAVMYLGRIVELGSTDAVFEDPLHPYTVALLSAIPVPDPSIEARRDRIVLRGDLPNPASPPSGCRFRTRCWLREHLGGPEECERDDPVTRPLHPGHSVACHFADRTAAAARAILGSPAAQANDPTGVENDGGSDAATGSPMSADGI
jgi:oligopeptide/dipeptide ABC transporter ATP-binding protein